MKRRMSLMSLLLWFLAVRLSHCLTLSSLRVPALVRANISEVLLDCPYDFQDEKDKHGLTVKWFMDSWRLVYQWIPEWREEPQVPPFMKDKIDVSFNASDDEYKRKRSLLIVNPDPSLSGVYTCKVSNYYTDVARNASLLVWAPAEYIDLFYERCSSRRINLTCSAVRVAPKPEFSLYIVDPNGTRMEVTTTTRVDVKRNGYYWSVCWGFLDYIHTRQDSIMGCTVSMPGTNQVKTLEKVYDADLPLVTTRVISVAPPADKALRFPPPSLSCSACRQPTNLFSGLPMALLAEQVFHRARGLLADEVLAA